jgi:predicted transcriptional regulator
MAAVRLRIGDGVAAPTRMRIATRNPLGDIRPGGYTSSMKVAISIPDEVFAEAEQLACELKQSRSQLYSRAVREYVARHSSDNITAALDSLCAEERAVADGFATAARRTMEQSQW